MAWAGTGALCVIEGGVLKSLRSRRRRRCQRKRPQGELSFVQISDSHMGFDKPANTDVIGTFKAAIDKINALPIAPEFLLHTGDISHLAKPAEFDNVEQILKSAKSSEVFYVPGEHDFVGDEGQQYPRPLRQRESRSRLVQLRQKRRSLHRTGQCRQPESRRPWLARRGATRVAGKRRQAPQGQHADRRLRPHPALDGLSRLGMGHRRQRAGAQLSEALRLGKRAQRTHPPDDAESGRQRDIPHRLLDRLPATEARRSAISGPDESSRRPVAVLLLGVTEVHYKKGQHALAVTDESLA